MQDVAWRESAVKDSSGVIVAVDSERAVVLAVRGRLFPGPATRAG
jgi:hypothetical protein